MFLKIIGEPDHIIYCNYACMFLPFIETFKRKGQVIVLGSILAIVLQSVKKQDKQQQQN